MRLSYIGRKATSGLVLLALVAGTESFTSRQRHCHHQVNNIQSNNSKPNKSTMCFQSRGDDDDDDNNDKNTDGFKVQTWNPLRLLVLRLGLTEPMATSPLNYGTYDGEFTCAYCGQVLFDSNAKYDSGSGWPSFWRSAGNDSMEYKMEFDGRLECRCKKCSSHLGHVFLDGPTPNSVPREVLNGSPDTDPRSKTGKYLPRFCVNGATLRYKERGSGETSQ